MLKFVRGQTADRPTGKRDKRRAGIALSSVLGSLPCLTQRRGFDPPLRRIFPVEGIFPLELTWVLTPFPKNSFR